MTNGNRPRVGVDVGGTFTDTVVLRNGQIDVTKTPSTPDKPETGVLNGLDKSSAQAEYALSDVTFLSHGTTVATNALLEGTWADTALVTTEGFRDALEIGRQNRPDIYDFDAEKADPIVPRDKRFTVPERLDERGDVLQPLDENAVRDVATNIADTDVSSVAISLLFAFENDDHECQVAEILRDELPDVSYSLSSVVLPEIREYERTLTTCMNAALKPVMSEYIGNLISNIRDRGIQAQLKLMQSNGGLITAEAARERPVHTLLSGPAAGVQGAMYVAERQDVTDVMTMDMGGTSCDVSLVEDGDPIVSTDVEVGDYTIGVPMIDVHTVGAGGGSIAWIDDGGALRVGPQSAGAEPGPICYGRGGERPTITDAHLLLGRLNPDQFLSGELDAEVEDVRDIVGTNLADPLNRSIQGAAQGVLDVANANMQRALRVVSVERGYDPREFILVAYGGAGPLHAPKLAADLGIPRVIVPRTAGVLSALGLLISDVVYDYSVSRVRRWDDLAPSNLAGKFTELREQGKDRLAAEDIPPARRSFEPVVDLRYAGQSFDLSIEVPSDEIDAETMTTIAQQFHDRHEQRYGHTDPEEPIELVTVRLNARGVVDTPDFDPKTTDTQSVEDAIREERTVFYDGEPYETSVYSREHLPVGGAFDGPAIVEGGESTVVVHPGQSVSIDDDANLVVETGGDS